MTNIQWSWGATRDDGAVFLRVWQDETKELNGVRYIRLVNHKRYEAEPENLGYKERLNHLTKIAEGAEAFAIILRAVDPKAKPREIAGYNANDVFPLGEAIEIDGDAWAKLGERIPFRRMRQRG